MLQRVLPKYRAPFFDQLGQACEGGLSLLVGQPRPEESIPTAEALDHGRVVQIHNRHFLGPQSVFYFCWQEGVPAWLQNWQPDVLVVEANPRYLSTPAAVRWMHRRGRPVLGWGLGAPRLGGALSGWRERSRFQFLRSLDGMIAYSQRGAEEYSRLGLPPERVFVAPNAAAPRPRHPIPERPALFEMATLLFVGRLQKRKRLDLLLQACAGLPTALQPQVWIVGDGPERQDLEAMSAKVYPQAKFFGAQHGEDLASLFATADLFVLPGTGGLAVQEAMAYGLPVIVARGDGTQEDLVRTPAEAGDNANGWQVPPDNLPALGETLEQALASPERLRRMGRASYRIVSEELNLEQMVASFVAAINTVAKRLPAP